MRNGSKTTIINVQHNGGQRRSTDIQFKKQNLLKKRWWYVFGYLAQVQSIMFSLNLARPLEMGYILKRTEPNDGKTYKNIPSKIVNSSAPILLQDKARPHIAKMTFGEISGTELLFSIIRNIPDFVPTNYYAMQNLGNLCVRACARVCVFMSVFAT